MNTGTRLTSNCNIEVSIMKHEISFYHMISKIRRRCFNDHQHKLSIPLKQNNI